VHRFYHFSFAGHNDDKGLVVDEGGFCEDRFCGGGGGYGFSPHELVIL